MRVATAPQTTRAPHGAESTGQDYALILDTINVLSKRAAVEFFMREFPSLSSSWVRRHWQLITVMSPDELAETITYRDDTGNTAATRVDAVRAVKAARGGGHA